VKVLERFKHNEEGHGMIAANMGDFA